MIVDLENAFNIALTSQHGQKAFNDLLKKVNDSAKKLPAKKKREYDNLQNQILKKVNESKAKAKESKRNMQNITKR